MTKHRYFKIKAEKSENDLISVINKRNGVNGVAGRIG